MTFSFVIDVGDVIATVVVMAIISINQPDVIDRGYCEILGIYVQPVSVLVVRRVINVSVVGVGTCGTSKAGVYGISFTTNLLWMRVKRAAKRR